jgi:hypothetical protein
VGVIVQKAESRPKHDGGEEQFCTFQVKKPVYGSRIVDPFFSDFVNPDPGQRK